MLDLNFLPKQSGGNTEIFTGTSLGGSFYYWQTWIKPRNKTMAHILLIGAGGSGGQGGSGLSCCGGGSGAQVSMVIPLSYLPDMLYISLGGGCKFGQTTAPSIISISNITTSFNYLAQAFNGTNATASTTNGYGTPGAGGAISTSSSMPIGWSFVDLALAGQSSIPVANITLPTDGLIVTAGSCGGEGGINGYSITGSGIYPTLNGGTFSTTGPGTNGSNGMSTLGRFYGGTGSGGSLNIPPVTIYSGNGAYGCGGGGAGGSTSGTPPNIAGDGGPGICFITTW